MKDWEKIVLLIFKIAALAAYAAEGYFIIKALILGIQLMEAYL